MKVKVAETAGFCFGVKRAVDKVYQLIEDGVSPIYTLGPIIHNEEVVSDLESRGVRVIEVEDLDQVDMPDPIVSDIDALKLENEELKRRIAILEKKFAEL